MKQKPTFWAFVIGLVSFCFISLPQPSFAQSTTDWAKMYPGANPPTVEAARTQCLRSKVSRAECSEFVVLLQAGQCSLTSVPDKTVYRFMNGASSTVYMKRKMLGGNTPALRCHISSGRVLDWYHESVAGTRACNNVGEPILQSTAPEQPVQSRTIIVPQAPTVLWFEGLHVPLSSCCTSCGHNHIDLPDTIMQINRNPVVIKEFSTPQRMN
jgi:hypothetical protein